MSHLNEQIVSLLPYMAIAGTCGTALAAVLWRKLQTTRGELENYREAINHLQEGFYRSTLDGKQIQANPALVRLNGTEVMRANDGTRCEGRLSGRIAGGRLDMREPGNLKCSNGSEIFRRDITCSLNAAGLARCTTIQPETNGRGTATLRRARR